MGVAVICREGRGVRYNFFILLRSLSIVFSLDVLLLLLLLPTFFSTPLQMEVMGQSLDVG